MPKCVKLSILQAIHLILCCSLVECLTKNLISSMASNKAILKTAADSEFCTKSITLYKYITPIALASLIEHGDLKLTYRKDANDPFECLPDGYSPQDEVLSHLGIVSLTGNKSNHPMWGNYADKYRGACIEFQIKYFYLQQDKNPSNRGEQLAYEGKELEKLGTKAYFIQYWKDEEREPIDLRGGDVLLKCEYSNNRSDPQSAFAANNKQQIRIGHQKWLRQIITKHTDWQYEDEYRVTMRHSRCSRFSEGPPSMYFTNALTRYITKIILGPKSEYSPLEVAFLISKRRNPLNEHLYIPRDVKIFKSKIQECSFDLEISEEDSLIGGYPLGIF